MLMFLPEASERPGPTYFSTFQATFVVADEELEELDKDQADYISVPVAGPYKPEYYRY